jgi:hypothetical protein
MGFARAALDLDVAVCRVEVQYAADALRLDRAIQGLRLDSTADRNEYRNVDVETAARPGETPPAETRAPDGDLLAPGLDIESSRVVTLELHQDFVAIPALDLDLPGDDFDLDSNVGVRVPAEIFPFVLWDCRASRAEAEEGRRQEGK